MSNEILDYINSNLWGVWYLIGAALVFWMQAGFAMVEAGFTRAKNSGNIIMKNLMDMIKAAMEHHKKIAHPSLDEVLDAEAETYEFLKKQWNF